MQGPQKARFQMFRSSHQFLAVGEPLVPLVPLQGELASVLQRLDVFAAEQDETKRRGRELTASIRQHARRLRSDHLRPIVLAAKAALHVAPELGTAIVPSLRSFGERDYVGLIQAANGVARAAIPHVERLVGAGLPKDFLVRLTVATQALQRALDARSAEVKRRVAVTEGVRRETLRGYDILRLIDSLATQLLRSDPVRLAQWKATARLPKVGQATVDEVADQESTPSGETRPAGGDAQAV